MKTYLRSLLVALALYFVPVANAGQAPDPELAYARQAFDEVLSCVPQPFFFLECNSLPGGTFIARFSTIAGDGIVAQAIQKGSAPKEWRVTATTPACALADNGIFTSMSQGFHPWKRDLQDFCSACVDDPGCLAIQP
jgi:hypothetical protein